MNKKTIKRQRRALRGWIKWVPVMLIPFSILFFHTWLNIQILRADYVLRELDGEARDLAERLNNTGMEETVHEDPNMLSEQAKLMDFVQPSPGQRESIPWRQLAYPEEANFAIARGNGASQPNPGATESLTDQDRTVAPAPSEAIPAPVSESLSLPTPAVAEAPAEVSATNTPVPAPVVPAPVVEAVLSATVTTNVVLELPEASAKEEVVDLESAMESLESL